MDIPWVTRECSETFVPCVLVWWISCVITVHRSCAFVSLCVCSTKLIEELITGVFLCSTYVFLEILRGRPPTFDSQNPWCSLHTSQTDKLQHILPQVSTKTDVDRLGLCLSSQTVNIPQQCRGKSLETHVCGILHNVRSYLGPSNLRSLIFSYFIGLCWTEGWQGPLPVQKKIRPI